MINSAPLKIATSLLVFGAIAWPLCAQDKASDKESKAAKSARLDDEDEDPEAADEVKQEGKGLDIGKLLPLNKPNLRVKIPGFDKGELASMIEAEKLTRIDDDNLKLEDAVIQLIPQALTIKLRTALYNTKVAVLSSNDSTTISSAEFTLTGDSMDFDTKTGKGRMNGKSRMLIHNVDGMGGKKKEPKPAAAKTTTTTTMKSKEELKR